ncbi:MAG: nitroreductase family protein [Rikenellaceae bacterium]|nr:nitroreductase family protein [Rikenellaceae bacterium]
MDEKIVIAETCIGCGRCVRVCPSKVIESGRAGHPVATHLRRCISCGHCVAICPTGAFLHADFPPERVHGFSRGELPSPEVLMTLMKARRSNRALSAEPVPREALERIVEAAHRAPTASNGRGVHFTVVVSPEEVRSLSLFTLEVFGRAARMLENPLVRFWLKPLKPHLYDYLPVLKRLQREFDAGNDQIMRGATAALLIHSPEGSSMPADNANLAYQNGSLMAEALGVSQFYMGFVCNAVRMSKGRLEKRLGIGGTIHAAMALGMPALRFDNYVDRDPACVDWR